MFKLNLKVFVLIILSLEQSRSLDLNKCKGRSSGLVDQLTNDLLEAINTAKCKLAGSDIWPDDYASESYRKPFLYFDYVIIGAGSAGSVLASRLSEDSNINILVLEAGGNPPLESELYTISLSLDRSEYSWNDFAIYNSNCCQAMKNGRCFWPRGKMIGGTGGLNGNVYLGGTPQDFDEWHRMGIDDWSWNNISFYYNRAVTQRNDENGIPLGSMELNYFQHPDNFDILVKLWINGINQLNNIEQKLHGPGVIPNNLGTIKNGIRMSTAKTYLSRSTKFRSNIKIIKNAFVTKILLNEKKRAIGVEFILQNSTKMTAFIKWEIILSAGAFGSPKLLMLSGIGHTEHLQSLNIKPYINLPVGDNLQDHGLMPILLKFTKNIPKIISNDEFGNIENIFDYLINQKGPLASNSALTGLIDTIGGDYNSTLLNNPNICLVTQLTRPTKDSSSFQHLQFKNEIIDNMLAQVENQAVLEIFGLLNKPKSRGIVRLKSNNPYDGPIIYNNFASDIEDRQNLLSFIRYIQKIIRTEEFQNYGLEMIRIALPECDDNYNYDTDDYWLCYIRYFYISSWHATGTVHMGSHDNPAAVVDSRLRVLHMIGLRVVDASIMPTITSSNTNTPTIVIAEKAADMIQADRLMASN